MQSIRSLLILGSALSLPVLAQTYPAAIFNSAQPSAIPASLDNNPRVRIPHSTHRKARPEYDAGSLDGATPLERMILVLGATAEQDHKARTLIDSQQTKGSPDYHRWITPEEFGSSYGPSRPQIQEVASWLSQQGFSVNAVAKSGRWIEFSGTSAQVEAAFQTQMHRYRVDGELHTANASDISVPARLAQTVRGLVSLHDFYSKPALIPANRQATAKLVAGKALFDSGDGFNAISPADFATIYDLNPLYNGVAPSPKTTPVDGSGQTIAIVAEGMVNTIPTTGVDDVASFRQIFGLPANPPNIVLTAPGIVLNAVDTEATLDVEWSGAVAPKATIDLVVSAGTNTTDPVVLSSLYIVDNNLAGVMNLSFSGCEQDLGTAENAFWNALFEQAAAQGIGVFTASGDWGAAGCEPDSFTSNTELGVNGLSSTPFNTSVGGTQFNETVNGGANATFWNSGTSLAIGYIPEMVWDDCPASCGYAGGGGISTLYPVPSWQTLPILGLTGARFANRVLPDLSLTASEKHDPYVFCFTEHPTQLDCQVNGGTVNFSNFAGGTSFASPAMAGVMALIDQAAGGRQGLANFQLYSMAAAESSSYPACNSSNQTNPATRPGAQCVFNDVTTGDNGVPGNDTLTFLPPGDTAGQLGYNAVPGFDPASGLGSIDAAKLVSAWSSAAAGFNGSSTTLSASFNGVQLPSSAASIAHGQLVSVTVSVGALSGTKSQTPGTEVALMAQGGNLPAPIGIESAPLSGSGGTATTGTLSVKALPAGANYNLYASFPGDSVFAGSTSNSVSLSVAAENTTTSLQSGILTGGSGTPTSGTTLDYADPNSMLVFTANVTGASGLLPTTGAVTFTDNGKVLSTVPLGPLPGGIARYYDCPTVNSCLTIGQHVIAASYSGDTAVPQNFNASASSSVTITVTKGDPIVVSVRAPATAIALQPVAMNTFVYSDYGGVLPTGTIQFLDNGAALGSPVALAAANGTNAAISATFTADGTHSLTAQYSGDSNYNPATSTAATLVITAPFALSAASLSQSIQQGATANYSLTLSNSSFAGVVNLTCTPSTALTGVQCTLPASETLAASTASVPFTVTVTTPATAQMHSEPPFPGTLPFAYAALIAVAFGRKTRKLGKVFLAVAALAVLSMSACGGGSSSLSTPPPPTYVTFTISATSGTQASTVALNLVINQ